MVFQPPFFQGLCSTLTLGGVFSRKLNLPPLKMDGLEDFFSFLTCFHCSGDMLIFGGRNNWVVLRDLRSR